MTNRKKTFDILALATLTIIAFVAMKPINELVAFGVLFLAVLVAGIWENQTVCHSTKSNDRSSYSASKA